MHSLVLKPGREKSIRRRHPWIFSGGVSRLEGTPELGESVILRDHRGTPLAVGSYSPHSQIRFRVWSFDPDEPIDPAFFEKRISAALDRRELLGIADETDSYRLVSAEADGVPGLVVDRYGSLLVCQFLTAGAERWRGEITNILAGLPEVSTVYERSDVEVRSKEGLAPRSGHLSGDEIDSPLVIKEGGLSFLVDPREGHKTGFYLDQRVNRALLRESSAGKEVLNCFAYTGGFGVAALAGGAASVVNVEDMASALSLIPRNLELNDLDPSRCENVQADVFQLLRQYDREERRFDTVVLDPPKFADSQKHLTRAARGYKDINRLAFTLLRPGGTLFTFSCSGLLKEDLFQKVVADAALDAGREGWIVDRLYQSPDHPTALPFPESLYLKGLRVVTG